MTNTCCEMPEMFVVIPHSMLQNQQGCFHSTQGLVVQSSGCWAWALPALLLTWKIPSVSTSLHVKLLCHHDSDFPLFSPTSINTLVIFQGFPTVRRFSSADSTTHTSCFWFPHSLGRAEARREHEDPLSGVSPWDARPTRAPRFPKASRKLKTGRHWQVSGT